MRVVRISLIFKNKDWCGRLEWWAELETDAGVCMQAPGSKGFWGAIRALINLWGLYRANS